MTNYQSQYESIQDTVTEDDVILLDAEDDAPPSPNILQLPEQNKDRWNHIEDLDDFFTRIYQYHQRSGIVCMLVQDIFQLLQFVFICLFFMFLCTCINYSILFDDSNSSHKGQDKVTISESIFPISQWGNRLNPMSKYALFLATVIFLYRLLKFFYMAFKYFEMYAFFNYALNITTDDVQNMTWHEVQRRLQGIQSEHQMCVHKQHFTELDIYHRILRFKNYMISMVNKSIIPLTYNVPLIGKYDFLSLGLKYNLEFILFTGPGSPFENNWHLKSDYKDYGKRKNLAANLSRYILIVGLANAIFSPIIFFWQFLYSFFRYTELLKRQPGQMGSRRWSHYARVYARHFNELDHEFNSRLARAYRPAKHYMDIFISPLLAIISKYITFFAGSILSVFILLTVYDEDFLSVKNVVFTMTSLGITVTIFGSCIPDEYCVWCPEMLLRAVLAQLHYIPVEWRGLAHKFHVRDQFASLFQYKVVYLLEEMLSPIVTPFILIFSLRYRSLEIVDFFRSFTINVDGVGDVCSFALMDVKKHGNSEWLIKTETQATSQNRAENGKTELSLLHFTLTNPEWKPSNDCAQFMENVKDQVINDADNINMANVDNALFSSLNSLNNITGGINGYTSMMSSIQQASVLQSQYQGQGESVASPPVYNPSMNYRYSLRGNLRNSEGPSISSPSGASNVNRGLLANLTQNQNINAASSTLMTSSLQSTNVSRQYFSEDALEIMSTEMSFSALYLHDQHRWRYHNQDASRSFLRPPTVTPQQPVPQLVLHDIQEDEYTINI